MANLTKDREKFIEAMGNKGYNDIDIIYLVTHEFKLSVTKSKMLVNKFNERFN